MVDIPNIKSCFTDFALNRSSITVWFSTYEEVLDWKFVEQAAERYEKAAKKLHEDAKYMKENNIIIGKL